MNTKCLNNNFCLPGLGLGTWGIGGGQDADNSKDEQWVEMIKKAIDIGYKHIDTAEMYGAGHSEELVCKAIKGVDRNYLTIASKVLNTHLSYDNVLSAAEASLKRLDAEYIDLYYIHAPNPDIPLKETMKAMDRLVEDKLVKNIAVSNFTVELLKEAQEASNNKIVANQIEYNLLTRERGRYGGNVNMESKTLPYCQENDILVVAERPLERGMLLEKHPLMDKMVEKYGKSYAQIAINWLVSQKNVVTIPKSSNEEHLKENFGATGWHMEEEDIEQLRREYVDTILDK